MSFCVKYCTSMWPKIKSVWNIPLNPFHPNTEWTIMGKVYSQQWLHFVPTTIDSITRARCFLWKFELVHIKGIKSFKRRQSQWYALVAQFWVNGILDRENIHSHWLRFCYPCSTYINLAECPHQTL